MNNKTKVKRMTLTEARKLHAAAVALIESKSIQKWATDDHNEKVVVNGLVDGAFRPGIEPLELCTWLIITAMG